MVHGAGPILLSKELPSHKLQGRVRSRLIPGVDLCDDHLNVAEAGGAHYTVYFKLAHRLTVLC